MVLAVRRCSDGRERLSKKIQLPLSSRFKILWRLDIAERRLPQDGRISIRIEDRAIDFRCIDSSCKVWRKDRYARARQSGSPFLDKRIVHPELSKNFADDHQPYGIITLQDRPVPVDNHSGSPLNEITRRKSTSLLQKIRSSTISPDYVRSRHTRISGSISR